MTIRSNDKQRTEEGVIDMLFCDENMLRRAVETGDHRYIAEILSIHCDVAVPGTVSYAIRLTPRAAEEATYSPFCACRSWSYAQLPLPRAVLWQWTESLTMPQLPSLPPDLQFFRRFHSPMVEETALPLAVSSRALPKLSRRQMHILRLLSQGLQNKAIAHQIHLSEGTVKNHVRLLMKKFGVRNRTQAVLKAAELGIVGVDRSTD